VGAEEEDLVRVGSPVSTSASQASRLQLSVFGAPSAKLSAGAAEKVMPLWKTT
jgi:hypothetical protein